MAFLRVRPQQPRQRNNIHSNAPRLIKGKHLRYVGLGCELAGGPKLGRDESDELLDFTGLHTFGIKCAFLYLSDGYSFFVDVRAYFCQGTLLVSLIDKIKNVTGLSSSETLCCNANIPACCYHD
jgi:hypothetical protein